METFNFNYDFNFDFYKFILNNSESITNNLLISKSVEEKVKIDRKKFELMLSGSEPNLGNAADFFGRVMEDESVQISWPMKLKSGTKSKKDPHIRISGTPEMVRNARIKVLEVLDGKKDRVTIKMDIDWRMHSNVIGRGGASIQKIMNDTGCHVHFPDSNRIATLGKSNQVSVAGTADGVIRTYFAIRQLVPATVSLDFQIGSLQKQIFDKASERLKKIQHETGTQIVFNFGTPNGNGVMTGTAYIRGCSGQMFDLKRAIHLLFTDIMAIALIFPNPLTFVIRTEIASHHHNFVMGEGKCNIIALMEHTKTEIIFPEMNDTRNTTIIIKGYKLENVFSAWKYLVKLLPLSLTFDLNEGQELDPETMLYIMNYYGVAITIKPKIKKNSKSVWIKTLEKDVDNLFAARKKIIEVVNARSQTGKMTSLWSLWSSQPKHNAENKSQIGNYLDNDKTVSFNPAPGAERRSVSSNGKRKSYLE